MYEHVHEDFMFVVKLFLTSVSVVVCKTNNARVTRCKFKNIISRFL